MKPIVRLILMALILTGAYAAQAHFAPQVTGMFSNMRKHETSGDVHGMEVYIVFSSEGMKSQHYAFVQRAFGFPGIPHLVPVTVSGDQVQFTVPGPFDEPLHYSGRVTKQALVLSLEGSTVSETVPRSKGYWR